MMRDTYNCIRAICVLIRPAWDGCRRSEYITTAFKVLLNLPVGEEDPNGKNDAALPDRPPLAD